MVKIIVLSYYFNSKDFEKFLWFVENIITPEDLFEYAKNKINNKYLLSS